MKYVGGITTSLMKNSARKRGFYESVLLQKWYEIFPAYAKFMRPVKMWKGRLTIATNSPSAAHNIKMQGQYLIQRMNQFVGYGVVKELKFEIRSFTPDEEEMLPTPLEVDSKAALDAKAKCASIIDDDLRACLERLGGVLEMEKRKKAS